jgi:MFS family permease
VAAGERGRAIGIHGAGGNLGEALAPAWAAFFAAAFDWRIGFLAAGLLAFACALLAASLPGAAAHDHDHDHDRDHDHDHDHAVPSLLAPARRPAPSFGATLRAFAITLIGFLHNRPLRWLFVALIAAGFVYRGFLTFVSLHIAEGGGAAYASYIMSAVLVAGMVAQRFGGELADRRHRERLFVVLASLLAPALFALAFARGMAAIALALVCGFVWAVAQPVANALTAAYARPADHGLLYGIQFAITFGVGSFATTVGGFFLQAGGTRLVFFALAAVAVVELGAVAAVLVAASRTTSRTPPPPPQRAPSTTREGDAGRGSAPRTSPESA